jgi:hypothetical protein
VDTRITGPRRERLTFDPATQQSSHFVELDGRFIEPSMRVAQRRNGRHDGASGAQMARENRILGGRWAFVLGQKRLQHGEMFTNRGGRSQRLEIADDSLKHAPGAGCP